MKNVPKIIYLQVDPENEDPDNFNDLSEVTWCKDKINDTDIEYCLSGGSEHKKGIEKAIKEL